MKTSTDYEVSYSPSLTPTTPHVTYDFISEIESYVTRLYDERVDKVASGEPLLSSVTTPYYEDPELDTLTAYSIDARNINKWISHFLFGDPAPNGTPTIVKIDIPPKKYKQNEETLYVKTAFGEIEFEIDDTETLPVIVDDDEVTLTISYNIETTSFELVFEETGSFDVTEEFYEPEERFDTTYDTYHSKLDGWTAEQHQPFAIYSPAVDFNIVKEQAERQTDESIVLVTNDGWQVCVRSPDEDDYQLDVSLVELLDPVGDSVVEHYETFEYPQRYIHLPELQYLHSLDAMLTDAEMQKLRVLPYAIPFGDETALFDKVAHAEQFTRNVEHDTLQTKLLYEQFFEQTTDSL